MYLHIYYVIYLDGKEFTPIRFDSEFEAMNWLDGLDDKFEGEDIMYKTFEIKRFAEKKW